jgi:acyl-CoA thioesterase FadM
MTQPAVAPGISSDLLWLEQAYRVRFDEATPDGLARTSALLGYLADVAWRHSEVLGFPRPWYRERGLAWVVRAIDLALGLPIHDGDEVRVSTRIAGFRRVMCRRRSEIRAADGTVVANVSVDWAMTDGRAPIRIPVDFTEIPGVDLAPFTPTRVDLPPAPHDVVSRSLEPRLRELDPMGHVNNAVYLDWMDEAITIAGGADDVRAAARRYRLEYLRSAGPGAALRSLAWREAGGWAWRLADDAGDLLRGRLDRPTAAESNRQSDGAARR